MNAIEVKVLPKKGDSVYTGIRQDKEWVVSSDKPFDFEWIINSRTKVKYLGHKYTCYNYDNNKTNKTFLFFMNINENK